MEGLNETELREYTAQISKEATHLSEGDICNRVDENMYEAQKYLSRLKSKSLETPMREKYLELVCQYAQIANIWATMRRK